MATIAAEALTAAGAREVLAIGGDADVLHSLGLVTVLDRFPGEGPLGALVTAMAVVAEPVVVVLACDLAAITSLAVAALVDGLGDHDVAVPATALIEPLCAAYRVARAGPALSGAFESGERAVHRALGELRVARVELDDWSVLRNVNRPEDLPR